MFASCQERCSNTHPSSEGREISRELPDVVHVQKRNVSNLSVIKTLFGTFVRINVTH